MLGNVLVSTCSDIVETNMLFCQTSRGISFIRKGRNRQKGVIFSLIVKADDIFVFLEIGTRNIHIAVFTSVVVVIFIYICKRKTEMLSFLYIHKIDLPKKLAICLSSIQSESLVRDLEMEEGRITIIKNMW